MIRQKSWRLLKMFYFKLNVTTIKILFILSCGILLSACSSFQTENKTSSKSYKKTVVQSSASNQRQSDIDDTSINLSKNNLIDPMADIQINSEIKESYKQTSSFIKQNKYQKALNLMIKVKGKYPQLSGPNYQMARIYLLQKQFKKALEQIDISVQKNPRNYYAISLQGVILKNQGKFKEAKLSYLKAIDIFPNYSKSHLNLGVLADLYLGDLELALSEYKTYMTLTSNKDKKVANWILEVNRRLKASK
jgi:tetratricopeptide (TPR) repeat protein